jgi:DNA-binding transcriptional ArsR family regulator
MTAPSEKPFDPRREGEAIVLDATRLRAIAHPVRVQLVGLLRKHGPSTATRLAERLGVNSGTASYHLRQLGAAGFVEEDTGRGNARERWWRSVHHATWFNVPELLDSEPAAALTYLQSVATGQALHTQRALGELQTMPRVWRDLFDISNWALRLTAEEALALQEDLYSVIARYRPDTPDAAAGAPDGAERITLIAHLLPELDVPVPPAPGSSEHGERLPHADENATQGP